MNWQQVERLAQKLEQESYAQMIKAQWELEYAFFKTAALPYERSAVIAAEQSAEMYQCASIMKNEGLSYHKARAKAYYHLLEQKYT